MMKISPDDKKKLQMLLQQYEAECEIERIKEQQRKEAEEKARREAEAEARRKQQERKSFLLFVILYVVIFSVTILILTFYQNNYLKDQRIQDIARKYNFQILTTNERKESTNGFSDTILAQEKSYSSGCVYFCSKNICWEKGYNADVFYREKYDNLKYKTENSLRTMLADELKGQLLTRTVNALMEICK